LVEVAAVGPEFKIRRAFSREWVRFIPLVKNRVEIAVTVPPVVPVMRWSVHFVVGLPSFGDSVARQRWSDGHRQTPVFVRTSIAKIRYCTKRVPLKPPAVLGIVHAPSSLGTCNGGDQRRSEKHACWDLPIHCFHVRSFDCV
jgi:hypothetical protein